MSLTLVAVFAVVAPFASVIVQAANNSSVHTTLLPSHQRQSKPHQLSSDQTFVIESMIVCPKDQISANCICNPVVH